MFESNIHILKTGKNVKSFALKTQMIYLRQKFSEDKRCNSYAWGKVLHYWTYIGNTNFIGDKSSQVHLYEDKQILFEEISPIVQYIGYCSDWVILRDYPTVLCGKNNYCAKYL